MEYLKAPFPYFGSKMRIADIVWQALGQPRHYMEPFFGSGAVLLRRPDYNPREHIETVCDIDGFIANVWRSLQFSPEETARWCDWPVNHADLMARRRNLLENESRLLDNLVADPEWHDPKLAGYWIWAASCWLGRGLTGTNARPELGCGGKGVHKLATRQGQMPNVAQSGRGVHRLGLRPECGDSCKSIQEPYSDTIYTWFRTLSERLRYVRVVCGDWTRICGGNWQDNMGVVGIFFDPPYGVKDRDHRIYHYDSTEIAKEVEKWCLERGEKETYRIVVAGYIEEYEQLKKAGWGIYRWKTHGGYANISRKLDGPRNTNCNREALFFSPHCLVQNGLFNNVTAKGECDEDQ